MNDLCAQKKLPLIIIKYLKLSWPSFLSLEWKSGFYLCNRQEENILKLKRKETKHLETIDLSFKIKKITLATYHNTFAFQTFQ